MQTAGRMCNNRQMCDVNVTNVAFGEPCPGVSTYLSVSFICGGKFVCVPRCFWVPGRTQMFMRFSVLFLKLLNCS